MGGLTQVKNAAKAKRFSVTSSGARRLVLPGISGGQAPHISVGNCGERKADVDSSDKSVEILI